MSEFTPKRNSPSSNICLPKTTNLVRSSKRQRSWWFKYFRLFHLRLSRLRGKPESIARGLSVGVFAGSFPFFGLQTVIGVILATCLRSSKIAAAAGTWISNPLTYVPLYIFNYKVGKLLLGLEEQPGLTLDLDSFSSFMELGFSFAATLLAGCLVVGIVLAIITYFVSIHFIKRWHKRNLKSKKKRLKKFYL
ncbi:Protein of unknown function DUF2062 [Stanieria cyanosphaera PCC 7437]|uniref:DUF2062 domain-containing protein n=1 Tax=Stanieria cyanosphaera (strain ATCC 29371 / PCC 7437) TaxID=111780 RepID=K9XMX3_STAC7|nr:DUF2062 domain-containing protein [Stanieria cyanosphaera]AFZ33863.1 Protein of unknown function DUF2062 [Stanieria cyanosphaera PCC 7437]